MFLVIVPLILGIIIGCNIKVSNNGKKVTSYITMAGLVCLLFSMGLGIGSNDVLVNNLKYIGIKAFVIALGSVVGSCVFLYILDSNVFHKTINSQEKTL